MAIRPGSSTEPLVSIGIPTYRRLKGFRRALDSLKKQTYSNLEIVISDNCSPEVDDKKKIVEEYLKLGMNIHFYPQEENRGPLFNFRFVLDHSHGDFFMWLCDDDWISPNYVQECIKAFDEDPNTILSTGEISSRPAMDIFDDSALSRVRSFFLHVFGIHVMVFGLIPKDIARSVETEVVYGAEWIWVADLLYMGNLHVSKEAIYYEAPWGLSYDNARHLAVEGLPAIQAFAPLWTLAIAYFFHVMKGRFPYDGHSFLKRFVVGLNGAASLIVASVKSMIFHQLKKVLPSSVVSFLNKHIRKKKLVVLEKIE